MSETETLPDTGPVLRGEHGASDVRQIILALVVSVVIVAGGLLAGVSQYAGARRALVDDARTRALRFDAVYREASEARLQALRLAAEIVARDTLVIDPLARRDRAELARRAVPLFEQILKPRFGVTLLGFQGTDETTFLRAHRPEQFGDSVAGRAMGAAVTRGRSTVAGLEIGRASGPELRAMSPVVSGETLVGTVELGSSLFEALQIAAQATGLDFGFAMDRRAAEALDRPPGPEALQKGDAVYIRFSRPEVRDLLAAAPVDLAEQAPQVVDSAGREIFVRTAPVLDVSRQPAVRITLVEDLTAPLAERRGQIVLYTALGTALLLALVLAGLLQFRALRTRLERSFSGRLREVHAKAQAYDRISQSLRDLTAWKLGLLGELVLLIRDPLTAVQGALETAGRAGEPSAGPALAFAAGEVRRLNAAVADHTTMLSMRDRLRRVEAGPVDLAGLADAVAADAGGAPAIRAAVPADLPPAQANAALLRAALRTLVLTLQRGSDTAPIVIEAAPEGDGIAGRIAGSGGWSGEPPGLEEVAAFGSAMRQQAGSPLILARLTVEHFGGTLAVLDEPGGAGFRFTLRAA